MPAVETIVFCQLMLGRTVCRSQKGYLLFGGLSDQQVTQAIKAAKSFQDVFPVVRAGEPFSALIDAVRGCIDHSVPGILVKHLNLCCNFERQEKIVRIDKAEVAPRALLHPEIPGSGSASSAKPVVSDLI